MAEAAQERGKQMKSLWFLRDVHKDQRFRKVHTDMLAKPPFRRIQQPAKRDVPNLNLGDGMMWPIRNVTMRAKPRHRTALLAMPKHKLRRIPEYLLPRPELHLCGPYVGGHYANPGALEAPCSHRIIQLAIPKKVYVESHKEEFNQLLGPEFEDRMAVLAQSVREIYPPTTVKSEESTTETKPRRIETPADWAKLREWLALRAIPKEERHPPAMPKKKRVKLKTLMKRIKVLSTPSPRQMIVEEDPNKCYEVSKAALNYAASERTVQLAVARERIVDRGLIPGKVSKAALQYKMSERVKALAAPIMRRQAPAGDTKEDAFQVIPRALTARCSKRTAELAQPVTR